MGLILKLPGGRWKQMLGESEQQDSCRKTIARVRIETESGSQQLNEVIVTGQ